MHFCSLSDGHDDHFTIRLLVHSSKLVYPWVYSMLLTSAQKCRMELLIRYKVAHTFVHTSKIKLQFLNVSVIHVSTLYRTYIYACERNVSVSLLIIFSQISQLLDLDSRLKIAKQCIKTQLFGSAQGT